MLFRNGILFGFLVISLLRVTGSNLSALITEVRWEENDTIFRNNFLYDDSQNKVLETKSYFGNSVWNKLSQIEWYYSGGKIVKQCERRWINSSWVDKYIIVLSYTPSLVVETHYSGMVSAEFELKKIESSYNAGNLVTKSEYKKVSNAWSLQSNSNYIYENGKLKSSEIEVFDQNGLAVSRFRETKTYCVNDTKDSLLLLETFQNGVWDKLTLTQWFYKKGTNLVVSQRQKKWNDVSSQWENSQMTTNVYDVDGKIVEEIYWYWKSIFWEKGLKYNYAYTNGSVSSLSTYLPIYNQWRNTITINYGVVSNELGDQTIQSVYGFWGGNEGELVSTYIPYLFNNQYSLKKAKQLTVSYISSDDLTESGTTLMSLNQVKVYPNPSNGIFYISTEDYDIVSWIITDMRGQVIKENNEARLSGVIDLTEFPHGVYFLRAETSDRVLIQKLIKK